MDIFYPVQIFADWITYRVFAIVPETMLAGAVNFFVYDTIKILILLAVIIYAVSIIRSFLPPEKIRAVLSKKGKYTGNAIAAAMGIVTPFCTCSAIPLFLGFVQAGVPLGVTFSFLVASPLISETALVMLWGMMGAKVALIYIASGFFIAFFSGIIISKMNINHLIEPFVFSAKIDAETNGAKMSWRQRNRYALDYTVDIVKKVWLYVVVGIGIGAWIHGYVPADFVARYASGTDWYAVPLAVIFGIPLYSSAAGIIPLISVFVDKGVAVGTVMAFMMAVIALSLPEFMILKRVMKVRLIVIFAGIVSAGIIFTGYLFNLIIK